MILFLVNKKRWIFNENRNAAVVPATTITSSVSSSPSLDINSLAATNITTEMTSDNDLLLTNDPAILERISELEQKAVKALEEMLR